MITLETRQNYDQSHGSPFDRGSADSYYGRPRDPHYWPEGTYNGTKVEEKDMTPEQVEAYYAGYQYNEEFGGKKDWDDRDAIMDKCRSCRSLYFGTSESLCHIAISSSVA